MISTLQNDEKKLDALLSFTRVTCFRYKNPTNYQLARKFNFLLLSLRVCVYLLCERVSIALRGRRSVNYFAAVTNGR